MYEEVINALVSRRIKNKVCKFGINIPRNKYNQRNWQLCYTILPFTLYHNWSHLRWENKSHTRNIKPATVSHLLKLDWWLIDSCLFGFGQKKCSQQNAPSKEAASKLAWPIHALSEPQQTVAIFGVSWTWTSACSRFRSCYCFVIAISVCGDPTHASLSWPKVC